MVSHGAPATGGSFQSPFSFETTRQHSTEPLRGTGSSMQPSTTDPEACSARGGSQPLSEEDVVVRTSRWSLGGILCLPRDIRHRKAHQDRKQSQHAASVPNHVDFRHVYWA